MKLGESFEFSWSLESQMVEYQVLMDEVQML